MKCGTDDVVMARADISRQECCGSRPVNSFSRCHPQTKGQTCSQRSIFSLIKWPPKFLEMLRLLWVRPGSQIQTRLRTCRTSRIRCLSSLSTLSQDLWTMRASSRQRAQLIGSKGSPFVREPPIASLMMPCVIRPCHFLDEAYHYFGTYGYSHCALLHGEMYHIGKHLSIWLRREFLRGGYKAKVDRGGWVPIDDIINEDRFWENVYYELQKHDLYQRTVPGSRIFFDKPEMAGHKLRSVDELMENRTWAIAPAIENELWNWGRRKKRVEFLGQS